MSDTYIGEVRAFGFTFAMRNWAYCDGQIIPIQQNAALFSILGTTYGGNGTTTFALPNLQGNAAMNMGQGPALSVRVLGEQVGTTSVTVSVQQMPMHNHAAVGATGTLGSETAGPVTGSTFSSSGPGKLYTNTTTPTAVFSPKAIGQSGNSQPHNNVQPLNVLNYQICQFGIFPSRN
ncbi:MAG: phage tail protein [Pseudolabrys sp.]